MKTPTLLLTLFLMILFASCSGSVPEESTVKEQDQLIRLTEAKIMMMPRAAARCRRQGPGHIHDKADAHIYANAIAVRYRATAGGQFSFPVGSVFYKEKFSPGQQQPHLATIMTKVANKGVMADWQFSMISLPDKKPQAIEAHSCADCHENYNQRGFISFAGIQALDSYIKREK